MHVFTTAMKNIMPYNIMYKQSLKQGLDIGQPFITIRNIIIDYQWLPHWKCTVTSNYNGQLVLSGRKQNYILLLPST